MNEPTLRQDLPSPIPERILKLPIHRGFPVPYFVAWLDDDERAMPRGQGTPDFRILFPGVVEDCLRHDKCWVCGGMMLLTRERSFLVGPMCVVNRTSAEPGGHHECMEWSAKGCPFMSRPKARRRGITTETVPAPGKMLARNPGVGCVWSSKTWQPFKVPSGGGYQPGTLINIGSPTTVEWWAEGREATREEVERSIDSGLPALQDMADEQGDGAPEELARMIVTATRYLPEAA